jgi:hypothetical protein
MTDRSAERTAARPARGAGPERGSDETAVRPALKERVQTGLGRGGDQQQAQSATARKKSAKAAKKAAARPPRRARLRLSRIDPWSVMKTSFLLSIAFGVVTIVSVLMVWSVLDAAGVWNSINSSVRDIVGGDTAQDFDIEDYVGTSRVVGFTMLIAVVDVVLLTAIATLGAFLYNMAAALLGGIEVTLAEDN